MSQKEVFILKVAHDKFTWNGGEIPYIKRYSDSNGILWLKEYGCMDGPLHPVQTEASKKAGERRIESTTVTIMLCDKINQ